MRTIAVIAVVAMAAWLAAPAHAQHYGVNLSWDDCGSAGSFDKSFDCGSDQGAFGVYASFVAPPGIDQLIAYTFEVGSLNIGALPTSWWDLGPGGCRAGTWSVSVADPGPSCSMPGSQPIVIAEARFDQYGHLRIQGEAVFQEPQSIPGDTEFYAFTLWFRNRLVNTCDGCCAGLCIVLGSIGLIQQGQPDLILWDPYEFSWVSWQGGWCGVRASNGTSSPTGTCHQTPTRGSTWGSLKALYR